MGATNATATISANNIRTAWNEAVEEANEYSGHQEGYSGDLNTCDFTKDLTYKLGSMTKKKLIDYMYEKCPKWEAWGFCSDKPVINTNKIKTVVTTNPQKGTRKWKTEFHGVNFHGNVVVKADSQTECIKKCRLYIEKNPTERLSVEITKVLQEGNTKCADIRYKHSTKEKKGTYIFVGLAAC
mgnify:CR=1 FL=1